MIISYHDIKENIIQRVTFPTVTYRTETWGLKEAEKRLLNVFEMKCLIPRVL